MYKPQIGDLLYIKKGRWETLGMIVEEYEYEMDQRWSIEWFGVNGKSQTYSDFIYDEIKEHHEAFLKLKESL